MKKLLLLGLLPLALVAIGCERTYLADGLALRQAEVVATDAQTRGIVIQSRRIPTEETGIHGGARQIVCAEPSPDVASAFAAAFGTALAAEIADGAPEVDASVSRATSEAIAQINRSNPVNILRDGLYRACEAYANGALTDEEYRILLSGLDEAIVTMALANDISRFAPAGAAASAGGTATAGQARGAASLGADALGLLGTELAAANRRLSEATAARRLAEERAQAAEAGNAADALTLLQSRRDEVEEARRDVDRLRSAMETALTQATSAATDATAAAGPGTDGIAAGPAEQIAEIYRHYARVAGSDYLFIACIHALRHQPHSALAQSCRGIVAPNFLLAMAARFSAEEALGPGNTVSELQAFLDRRGFHPGPIDGRLGPLTWQAWAAYVQSLPQR